MPSFKEIQKAKQDFLLEPPRHVSKCPMCGANAIVELPPLIRAIQPDDTTLVCHPMWGGCNQGWTLDEESTGMPPRSSEP